MITHSWQVVYYTTSTNKNPVSDFFDSCSELQQTKILRIIKNISQYGLDSAIPHLRKIQNTPFWEIRVLGRDNIRVIYAVPLERTILLLHGFIKKSPKAPPRELLVAKKRYGEWVLLNISA